MGDEYINMPVPMCEECQELQEMSIWKYIGSGEYTSQVWAEDTTKTMCQDVQNLLEVREDLSVDEFKCVRDQLLLKRSNNKAKRLKEEKAREEERQQHEEAERQSKKNKLVKKYKMCFRR
jgi:hypothetical protein